MTEPPYLSEYQAGYIHVPGAKGVVQVRREPGLTSCPVEGCALLANHAGHLHLDAAGLAFEVSPAPCRPGDSDTVKFGIRKFDTGASRDTDDGKLDFEGFLSPQVLLEFAEYMHQHRLMKDGSVRDSDNWQKGMPRDVLMKSLARHFFDLWLMHRLGTGEITRPGGEVVTRRETYGGVLFNLSGLWLDTIKSEER